MGKMIDITGQKFGKLTVIENAGKRDGRRYYWKCKCECGNEIIVLGTSLRNGNTKSCGCGKYEGIKKYNQIQSENNKIPIGTRFNKLVVIEDMGIIDGRRRYKCKCDCGTEKIINGNLLKQGQVNSCGKCISSLGEQEICSLLDTYNINYQNDVSFPELIKETGRRLRFDFILYDKTFEKPIRFIEFDGRQHISGPESVWNNTDSLQDIQERDNIKNSFCLKHKYPLVRIPCDKLHHITIQDLLGDKYLVKGE